MPKVIYKCAKYRFYCGGAAAGFFSYALFFFVFAAFVCSHGIRLVYCMAYFFFKIAFTSPLVA
jgi:hypothetical protein